MNQFDQEMKEMAQAEGENLPQWAKDCVEDALSSLPRQRKRRAGLLRIFGSAVAAMLVLFITLPNLSAQAAAGLQSLPVVGPLFQVVTFRTYVRDDIHHPAQVEIPQVGSESPALQPAVEQINTDIQSMTDRLIDQFEQDAAAIGDQGYSSLSVQSQMVTNTDRWFTLRLEIYQGGGSGSVSYRYYHIDKESGEIVSLSDLFASQDYVEAISEEIKAQMRVNAERYWVDTPYEGLNFQSIDPDQNFYFAKNGDIVIAFDEYEVAPGSTGCPVFQIPKAVYEAYLK